MNIFVGGFPWATTEEQLKALFGEYGDVKSCKIIFDRETGKSRGIGFVDMPNDEHAQGAMESLNGSEFGGRRLNVTEARPREHTARGGFNGQERPYHGGEKKDRYQERSSRKENDNRW